MVSTWIVQGHPQGIAGLKPRPTANSINSAIPLPIVWLGIWNARVCWNEMLSTVIWLDLSDEDPMDQLRGHSITYRIAWCLSKDAKYSRCKHCLELKNLSVAVRVRWLVFRCMPVWQPLRSNAISWNVCAVTLPDMDVGYLDA